MPVMSTQNESKQLQSQYMRNDASWQQNNLPVSPEPPTEHSKPFYNILRMRCQCRTTIQPRIISAKHERSNLKEVTYLLKSWTCICDVVDVVTLKPNRMAEETCCQVQEMGSCNAEDWLLIVVVVFEVMMVEVT